MLGKNTAPNDTCQADQPRAQQTQCAGFRNRGCGRTRGETGVLGATCRAGLHTEVDRETREVTCRQVRAQYGESDGVNGCALSFNVRDIKIVVPELADVEICEQLVERNPADRRECSAAQVEGNIAASSFQQVARIHSDRDLHAAGYVGYVNKADGTGDADVAARQVKAGIARRT